MSTKQETDEIMRRMAARHLAAQRKRRRTKRIITIVCIVLAVILILVGMVYGIFRHYYDMMHHDNGATAPSILSTIAPDDDVDPTATNSDKNTIDHAKDNIRNNQVGDIVFHDNVYNLLLIGTDARDLESERGRSDAMIVLSVNKSTKKITMTSIMRDTYLHIPEVGYNRVNAAYSYGGAPLLVQTLEENFGFRIDNYVVANFGVFKEIVDQVGGVDLDISASEIDVMNMYIDEYNSVISGEPLDTDKMDLSDAGYVHLNGKQALSYCRIRYVGNGDFDRTGRQREVMDLILQKCKSMSISELNKLAETVLPWLTTDLSASDALSLASAAILKGYYKYDIQSIRIPNDETWDGIMVDGMSVLSIDFDANRDLFFETVYGKSYEDLAG